MPNQLLIDSSFLYELNTARATFYPDARAFLEVDKSLRIIPDVVLTEVTYLLRVRSGQRAVLDFLVRLSAGGFQLEPVHLDDMRRVREIMAGYAEANLDFVDCCIMALAERLNITQVCTFDRRDFAIFRPTHCDYLELLP